MREFRLLGPPGTGKTTWIQHQIVRAAKKYHPDEIYLCSFTKAAAVEIASRLDAPIVQRGNLGTIHALCFRALSNPRLAETLFDEWNELHTAWTMDKGQDKDALDDMTVEPGEGQNLLSDYNRARATLTPPDRLPPETRAFADAWEDFKQDHDALDFTDLLLQAPATLENGKVLIVDEAQDMSPLQWRVVRQWGEQCNVFVCAGDEDQCIYRFAGANPRELMTPLPPENILTLRQSYRVPAAIHDVAEKWIKRLGDRRNKKEYLPTAEKGEVIRSDLGLGDPESLARALILDAAAGQTVMCLATCGYMLRGLLEELKSLGAPFANPYRRRRGDWNPLGKQATARRAASFGLCVEAYGDGDTATLRRKDTWGWLQLLRAKGNLKRGIKAKAKAADESADFMELAGAGLEPDTIAALLDDDRPRALRWFADNLTAEVSKTGRYAIDIIKSRGREALFETPRIMPGTIHSVKGGEADVVYLCPDLSKSTMRDCVETGRDAEDSVRRVAYVGMTRARKKLVLCESKSKWCFEI